MFGGPGPVPEVVHEASALHCLILETGVEVMRYEEDPRVWVPCASLRHILLGFRKREQWLSLNMSVINNQNPIPVPLLERLCIHLVGMFSHPWSACVG